MSYTYIINSEEPKEDTARIAGQEILDINKAAELGREGFYNGLKAPAQDAECLKMIEGRPIGDMVGLAILDSWLSAWHYEQMRSTIKEVD